MRVDLRVKHDVEARKAAVGKPGTACVLFSDAGVPERLRG